MTRVTRALGAVLLASTALFAAPVAAQDAPEIEAPERGYSRGDGGREARRAQAQENRAERSAEARTDWAEQARAAQQARAQAQAQAADARRDAWRAQADARAQAEAARRRRDNSVVVPGGRGAGFDPEDWHRTARERQEAAARARAERERDRAEAVRERIGRERDRSYGADRDRGDRDDRRDGRYRDGRDRYGDYRDGRYGDGRYRGGRYDGWRQGGVYDGRYGRYDRWDRQGWRNDRRYDWYRYRQANRNIFQLGRYYAPVYNYRYSRIGLGFHLGRSFYTDRYWINDPWRYRLPQVYGPYRWVRYYDDVLLVDIRSGQVVDVIYDFFW